MVNNIKQKNSLDEIIKERNLKISFAIQVVTLVSGIIISYFFIEDKLLGIIITLLLLLVENMYTISLKIINTISPTQIQDAILKKSIVLNHIEIAYSNLLLKQEYDRAFDSFTKKINDLSRGYFKIDINKIPQISMAVIKNLEISGFATVVVGDTDNLFYSNQGREYLEVCYEAANRIKNKFIRVFIIRDYLSINSKIYDIIDEHQKNGIETYIVLSKDLSKNRINPKSDFAIWDNNCLMEVNSISESVDKKLEAYIHVEQKNEREMSEARQKQEKIMSLSLNWPLFKEKLCESNNQVFWNTMTQSVHMIPPPATPSESDVNQMISLGFSTVPKPSKILLLGYTKKIVDTMLSYTDEVDSSIKIDVLDNGVFQPNGYNPANISFIQGNWLTWDIKEKTKYDIVIGDDVLANLSIWQYHIFFRNIHNLMTDDGILIMRVSSIYESNVLPPKFEDVFKELSLLSTESLTDLELKKIVLVKTWPMFHSEHFYDENTQSFNMSKWDDLIEEEIKKGNEKAKKLKLDLNITMTSLRFEELIKNFETLFNYTFGKKVDNYIPSDEEISRYYKIICLNKKLNKL